MNDIKVFQTMLGNTDPWMVKGIEFDQVKETITIEMGLKGEVLWACSQCRKRMHAHACERRRWRHLDTQQYATWIVADAPLVQCEEHGTQQVRVPWAEPYARMTMAFENMAMVLLKGMTTAAAKKHMGISWDQADGIKQRAVVRGLERREVVVMKHLCVDEKHAGKKLWLTIVSCVDDGKARVVYMAPGKDQAALDPFWQSLSKEQLAGIESIAMDMSDAFTNSVLALVPEGRTKIVYDRYHVSQNMGKAVDEVRRQEQAQMTKDEAKSMKGSRYWWLYNPNHIPSRLVRRFRQLRDIAHKTAKAWEFKELLRAFWDCPDEPTGRYHLREWLRRALRSALDPIRRVAKMCRDHLENLLTYFAHRATNASAEAINSRIQALINQACGYRNANRLMADIYFHFGGLDMKSRPIQ